MSSRTLADWDLPELESSASVIRISPEVNVPMTQRVQRIIDSAAFRRLSQISQLGLVAFVYPGATHTRFEHSLGVYRNAIDFLRRLADDALFCQLIDAEHARLFLLSALLHDIGHWPFCHAIEDMRLQGIPHHESLARRLITSGELADRIERDWQLAPESVATFLAGTPLDEQATLKSSTAIQLLQSMLSGPIDIDKIDYLERDSLHAGVPYGRNFDRNRLVSSLCVDPTQFKLAISDKGRTAAEMLVFARYIMFSEVYWHHAVRSATAMLQRGAYELSKNADSSSQWLTSSEPQMIQLMLAGSQDQSFFPCIEGLFGSHRRLYKRVAQFDNLNHPEQHRVLARKPYPEIVEIAQRLCDTVARIINQPVGPHDILIDAPPMKLEVQFQLNIRQSDGSVRSLGESSPIVHALATRQFDDVVKRVRIFVRPELQEQVRKVDFADIL